MSSGGLHVYEWWVQMGGVIGESMDAQPTWWVELKRQCQSNLWQKWLDWKRTVLARDEFQRSSYCFTQMEGCQERAQTCSLHDSLTSRPLQMGGCVVLMDMNQYWAFPCPWWHQTLLHLEKMTMSNWHSSLPIYYVLTQHFQDHSFSAQRCCTSKTLV